MAENSASTLAHAWRLRPAQELDAKWRHRDPAQLIAGRGLADAWNELVRDGEAEEGTNSPGRDCGTLTPGGGPRETPSSRALSESWSWGRKPEEAQVRRYLDLVMREQRRLGGMAADTTLFSARMRRRLMVLERQVVAAKRAEARDRRAKTNKATDKEEKDRASPEAGVDIIPREPSSSSSMQPPATPAERAARGLAKLGSNAALSFAFAFLRRAWRSGSDSDLCSELLEDTLEALRTLPEASFFDAGSISGVWKGVIGRTTRFLRAVVTGEEPADALQETAGATAAAAAAIPEQDRHLALMLLLEFAVQNGELGSRFCLHQHADFFPIFQAPSTKCWTC